MGVTPHCPPIGLSAGSDVQKLFCHLFETFGCDSLGMPATRERSLISPTLCAAYRQYRLSTVGLNRFWEAQLSTISRNRDIDQWDAEDTAAWESGGKDIA